MARSRIEGKVRMRKVLKILPETVRKQIKVAVRDGAEMIADTQRNLAPVRTGALRDSIKVTPGNEDLPAYASLKSRKVEGDPELAAIITAGNDKVRYAHLQEFGTAPHINQGQFPGTQNPGTAAQAFFFPGFRARRKQAQAKINKAARQGIKDGLR